MYRILSFGISDIGLVRQNNEDAWIALPELHFFALADGMGGHKAGEVAAAEAINAICRSVKKIFSSEKRTLSLEDMCALFRHIISRVNTTVYQLAQTDIECKGMGTT